MFLSTVHTLPYFPPAELLMQLGGPDDEDAVTLEIKADLQLILSTLCESDLHRKVNWDCHL